jgi:hypothetical protein
MLGLGSRGRWFESIRPDLKFFRKCRVFMCKHNMNDIVEIIKNAKSKSEICKLLNWSNGGKSFKKIDEIIITNSLDVSFKKSFRKSNYELVEKACPVCSKKFTVHRGHTKNLKIGRKEKTTCSHSCSNTFFKSAKDHPLYKSNGGKTPDASYRRICFEHHKKECIICKEQNVVEVHHYDGVHENNKPENLVPLCPTHHRYWHSRYRSIIRETVDKYVKKFITNMVTIV